MLRVKQCYSRFWGSCGVVIELKGSPTLSISQTRRGSSDHLNSDENHQRYSYGLFSRRSNLREGECHTQSVFQRNHPSLRPVGLYKLKRVSLFFVFSPEIHS